MSKSKFVSLSSREKEYHLQFLRDQISEKGVDPEFIPCLKQINSIAGVCTTQSCTGHKRGKYQDDGHIRLRLSAEKLRTFRQNIYKFYECPFIGYVDLRYQLGRKYLPIAENGDIYEEIMINFLGLNRRPEIFHGSIEHIIRILKNL